MRNPMTILRILTVAIATVFLFTGCATISDQELRMADSHRKVADVKLGKGENEAAIREYRNALGYDPWDAEAHFGIAEAYKRKSLYTEAEMHLKKVIKSDPDHQRAHLNLGVLYMLQERWTDAAELFAALSEDPTFVRPTRALVNLGWSHYNLGDLTKAKLAYERALRADPNNHIALLDLGIAYYDEGELVEAIKAFDKAAVLLAGWNEVGYGPVEAEVRFRAARAQVKLGQRTQAVKQLEIASERGGKGEWARKSREYLEVLR